MTDNQIARLRAAGWSVAVHNDYHIGGEPHTFWLLTHPCGRWIKGEGRTDQEALEEAVASLNAPAVPEGWEREARQHIVELEQCSLFVDSAPLAKAMTNAADFLRKLATSDARPLPTEGDAGRAALEAEKTTHQEPKHEKGGGA